MVRKQSFDCVNHVRRIEQAPRKIDCHRKIGIRLSNHCGDAERLIKHKISKLANPVLCFGGHHEIYRANFTAYWVRPAHQGFSAANRTANNVNLGLIGNPNLPLVDCLIKFADQRQFPFGGIKRHRIIFAPPDMRLRRFFGGDQRATQTVRH